MSEYEKTDQGIRKLLTTEQMIELRGEFWADDDLGALIAEAVKIDHVLRVSFEIVEKPRVPKPTMPDELAELLDPLLEDHTEVGSWSIAKDVCACFAPHPKLARWFK